MGHLMTKVGEYAIILNQEDEFLMLQFGEDLQSKWHFPGGRLDEGEGSIEGLKREIKEETNLEVAETRPVFTIVFDPNDQKYGVFFIAKVKEPYEVRITDEHKDFRWFRKSDLDSIDFWQPFYRKILEDNL